MNQSLGNMIHEACEILELQASRSIELHYEFVRVLKIAPVTFPGRLSFIIKIP